MGKVIFIGRTGCGKTTLCQRLHKMQLQYRKTQAVELYDKAIDTPGEYMENRNFYRALIMTAVDAKLVAIIADPTVEENYLPPAFTGTFARKVIGIVTKINLVEESKRVDRAKEQLKQCGISKIFLVDTVDGIGIEELFLYINEEIQ